MNVNASPIAGVVVVGSPRISDSRGEFQRLFCDRELACVLGVRRIVQINRSLTAQRASVRGMHFQHAPHREMKFVRCLRGRVWDVAVDLRAGSPTLLRWHAEELSAANGRMLVIPEGCAHGFQALEPDTELLYLHTAHYAPGSEGGFRHDDPRLGIAWPLPPTGLSPRDAALPLVSDDFTGLPS